MYEGEMVTLLFSGIYFGLDLFGGLPIFCLTFFIFFYFLIFLFCCCCCCCDNVYGLALIIFKGFILRFMPSVLVNFDVLNDAALKFFAGIYLFNNNNITISLHMSRRWFESPETVY